jgi:hypothetical protein
MAFKFSSGVDKFRDALIRRMVENSYPQEYAERTFRQIEGLWRLRLSGIARREHRPDRLRLQLCPPRNGSSLVVAGNRLAFDQSYQWVDGTPIGANQSAAERAAQARRVSDDWYAARLQVYLQSHGLIRP